VETIMTKGTREAARFAAAAMVVALVSLVNAGVAQAQAGADARWDAFIGCWSLTEPGLPGIDKSAPVVCVTPTATTSAVQVATIRNDSIVGRDTIDASGTHRALNKQGCAGWENAEWSEDSRRVYLHSDVTCAGGLKRTGTGVFAIAPNGQWLDVQSMLAGGNEGVRVNHYRELPAASTPKGIANPVAGRELAVSTQRTAAGGTLTVANIADAVQHTDTAVSQAWLVERGMQYNLDAKKLVQLADAGVPGSVTDVMVGLSYPEHFALQAGPGQVLGSALSSRDSARIVSEYVNDRCFNGVDPMWDVPGSFDPCYGTNWGLRSYGYGYGFGYGSGYYPYGLYDSGFYNPYGFYNGFGGGYYAVPVVVVKGDQAARTHGRVVNGRGYSQGSNGSGAVPTDSYVPRSNGSSGSGSGSSGSSSSGSSGSSRSSGSSGSSSGRTAVPRPPR
jgi:uncharacterized membrane protein YgcG